MSWTRQFPSVVDLWVTQGKTDHMATLEDPEIYSLLKNQPNSLYSISLTDFLSPQRTVTIKWNSTNRCEEVEASMIRIRDIENEGRRRGGRSSRIRSQTEPVHPMAPKRKSSRNTDDRKKRPRLTRASVDSHLDPCAEDTHKAKQQNRANDKPKITNESNLREQPEILSSSRGARNFSTKRRTRRRNEKRTNEHDLQPHQIQIRHITDLLEEEFDSSDDELIVHRMNLERKREALMKLDEKNAKKSNEKDISSNRTISSPATFVDSLVHQNIEANCSSARREKNMSAKTETRPGKKLAKNATIHSSNSQAASFASNAERDLKGSRVCESRQRFKSGNWEKIKFSFGLPKEA